jgi:pimeloyl-ACP methyl ester carboxylesterase
LGELYRDGVTLYYEDAGKGASPLLFIHGLGGDHTTFVRQFEHFRRHHRVVAIDLRGHGRSDAPPQGYTLAELSEELAWACYELGLYRPVFIGQGLGGMIAVECACRHPDLPAGIAALDAPLPPTPELRARTQRVLDALSDSTNPDALRQALEGLSLLVPDPQRRTRILEQVASLPPQVATSLWESACGWDASAALAACHIPMLYIAAGASLADLARLRELCPQIEVGSMMDAGPDHPSGAPAQANDLLERFLHTISP